MEKIGRTMSRVINAPQLNERFQEIRQEVLNHPNVQQFLSEHAHLLNDQVVQKSLGKLYEYVTSSHQCEDCPSLQQCQNVMKGFEPKLVLATGFIDLDYVKCPTKQLADEQRAVAQMIESMHMPKDVLQAQLADIDLKHDPSRLIAVEAAAQFLEKIDRKGQLPDRGLYLHGPFGTGKSFVLGAMANELAHRKIRTVIVYLPEFLRELKQSIQDQTLNEKIDFVKKAPVLMLDDFGAETISAWARDEVIGTILQYRMAEHLPTFFTSNFSLDELEHHLTYTQRGEKEEVKAARLMERIRMVSSPIALRGKNWRRQ